MTEVTLHYRADRLHKTCAVCGADLNRRVSRWWLTNCWTEDQSHYHAQQTSHPAETVRPCGVLDRSKTPNAALSAGEPPADVRDEELPPALRNGALEVF